MLELVCLLAYGAWDWYKNANGTMESSFPFDYSGWEFWTISQDVLFILEIFRSGKPK